MKRRPDDPPRRSAWWGAVGVGLLLAGCAAVVNSRSSEVQIRTNPERASCELSGEQGFRTVISTPAFVEIPHSAAPITVSCTAPGHRRSIATLYADSSGWIWGNSALLMATGGVAVLGLAVDQVLGADRTLRKEMNLDLDPEGKRAIRTRARDGGQILDFETR